MARKSLIAREVKRERLRKKYEAIRKDLLAKGDYEGLQAIPRNASPVRQKNRCLVSGRPRGYYRKFGISRLVFREMALKGEIPGIKKSSW